MQFSLRSLFLSITVLALFCGAVFSLPVAATGWVLAITLLLSPAVWVSGASFAADGKQAFFRGGLVCGILPFVIACYYLLFTGAVWRSWYSTAVTPVGYAVSTTYQDPYALMPPASSDSFVTGVPSLTPYDDVSADEPAAPDRTYNSLPPPPPSSSRPYYQPMPAPVTPSYAETLGQRLTFAGIWLAPGFFAFCGGAISYCTYRLLRPAAKTVEPIHEAPAR